MEQATNLMKSFSLPNFDRKDALPVVSVAAAVSIFYASYRLLSSSEEKRHTFKKIPIPSSSYPIVGHMMSLGKFPGKTVSEWHKKLGPILNLRMGNQNWIMIDDPMLAHKVFVTNGAETSYRPSNVFALEYHNMGGKGVSFSQPDGHWKATRAAALNVLAPKHIDSYMPLIHEEAKDLAIRLIESSEKEDGVNPFKYLELNSTNVVNKTVFGKGFESVEDSGFLKMVKIAEDSTTHCALENDLGNIHPLFSIYDYFFNKDAERRDFFLKERNPFFRKLIEEAAVSQDHNVVKALLEDGFKVSDDEVLAIAADLIIGGTDTTSVSLLWNIAIMCNYPEFQKKAIAEIDEFVKLNGRLPSFKERSHFPHCISIIKECMRFRPITPFGLPHFTKEDIYVDEYIIPKGSTLISTMSSMHMNPNFYSEPEKFNPARFLNNTKTMQSSANGKIEERDHFNFGWGRRICPGIYLAEAEMFIAFVEIFSRCFVEPTSDGQPNINTERVSSLTILPVDYRVKFTKRINGFI
ncbi:cytochrome P450 [Thamnidium elegans]|nr:cytochrome P450 [Thamnidium elegans]BDB32879.1 cytochrome P450 monooxygenase [Thamnidium elegans]